MNGSLLESYCVECENGSQVNKPALSREPNGSKLRPGQIGSSIAMPDYLSRTHRIFFFVIMQKSDPLMQDILFPTVHSDLTPIRPSIVLNIIEDHTHQDKGLF